MQNGREGSACGLCTEMGELDRLYACEALPEAVEGKNFLLIS